MFCSVQFKKMINDKRTMTKDIFDLNILYSLYSEIFVIVMHS